MIHATYLKEGAGTAYLFICKQLLTGAHVYMQIHISMHICICMHTHIYACTHMYCSLFLVKRKHYQRPLQLLRLQFPPVVLVPCHQGRKRQQTWPGPMRRPTRKTWRRSMSRQKEISTFRPFFLPMLRISRISRSMAGRTIWVSMRWLQTRRSPGRRRRSQLLKVQQKKKKPRARRKRTNDWYRKRYCDGSWSSARHRLTRRL